MHSGFHRVLVALFFALAASACAGERPTLSETATAAPEAELDAIVVSTTVADSVVVPLTTLPDAAAATTTTAAPREPRQAAVLGVANADPADVAGQIDVMIGGTARCGLIEFNGIEAIGSVIDLQVITDGGAPCDETVFLQLLQLTPEPGTYDIFVNGTLVAAQFAVA